MSEILLSVQELTKNYKTPSFWGGKPSENVLKNINLELHRGECLGVLGKNGAGKSTLLKIIDGAILHDSGEVILKGKVASIIELSSNVISNLSGLDNARMFFKLHGYRGAKLEERIQLALNYSELGDAEIRQVAHYSSGMRARLAFSLAIHLDFDILLMDEVLAVGDFEFQQKCLGTLNEIRKKCAIIFISHSVNSQRQFCDRGIVLEQGRIGFSGGIDDAINYYLSQSGISGKRQAEQSQLLMFGDEFYNQEKVQVVEINTNKYSYAHHEKIVINLHAKFSYNPQNLIVGLPLWDEDGRLVTALNSDLEHGRIKVKNSLFNAEITMDCDLNPGVYHSVLAIVDSAEYLYRQPGFQFEVRPQPRLFGIYTPKSEWNYEV
jgi:ABC-type polysaccharide/polyol phosphate transport system ATPase subunit